MRNKILLAAFVIGLATIPGVLFSQVGSPTGVSIQPAPYINGAGVSKSPIILLGTVTRIYNVSDTAMVLGGQSAGAWYIDDSSDTYCGDRSYTLCPRIDGGQNLGGITHNIGDIHQKGSLFGGNLGHLLINANAPTAASGGCTAPGIPWNNGTASFKITIGTTCAGIKTVTLTMPAASNGWACSITDNTTPASFVLSSQSTSTTALIISNWSRTTGLPADFTDGETLIANCMAG